jgi:plasmid stability protein
MADVKIRNLDDRVVKFYRDRAARAGRSLEEELRQTLADNLKRRRREAIERADALRARLREKYGTMPDSAAEIRAERDERERRILGD